MNLTRRVFGLGLLGLGPLATLQTSDERSYDAAGFIPTVVDGTAYIVGNDHGLQAVDTASGSNEWHNDEIEIHNRVTVVDDICFAPREDGAIVQIDADSGETIGPLEATVRDETGDAHPPLVADGICYLQTDDELIAVDYLNDDQLWANGQYSNPSRLNRSSIPAIADGRVVALGSETIGAFDDFTGEVHWEIDYTPSPGADAPVISEGRVYVAADTQVVCADLVSGDVSWQYSPEYINDGRIELPAVVGDTVLITGTGAPHQPSAPPDGMVEALSTSVDEPSLHWSVRYGNYMTGGGTTVDGTFIVCSDGAILGVNIDDGTYEEIHGEESDYVRVLLAENRLFVHIYGFGGPDVRSFELEDISESFGSRGYDGTFGHHDGWAERAALSVDRLELAISDEDPVVGDSIAVEVEAHLESGVEANVTDVAEITVNGNAGPVGENGSIQLNESGPVTIEAEYKGSTTSTTIEVQGADDANGGDDDMPGAGVIVAATSLGTAAYLLSQRERNRGRSRGSR